MNSQDTRPVCDFCDQPVSWRVGVRDALDRPMSVCVDCIGWFEEPAAAREEV